MAGARGSDSQSRGSVEAIQFLAESLHLILLPTERCNFRCVYCYESFDLGRMSDDVIRGVVNLLERAAPSLRWLRIEWFGGEPLLAFEEIERIQNGVARLGSEFPELSFAGAMTTNGYLLSTPRLMQLVNWGVSSFQVSLDGDEEAHDERRYLANGRGSWQLIYRNLLAAAATDLQFLTTLRIHVDRLNCGPVEELIERLAQDFRGDTRFELLFQPVSRLGGEKDASLAILGDGAPEVMGRLVSMAESLGLSVRSGGERTPCYAAMPNSLVIRPNGQIAKCTVALNDPRNHLGWLHSDGRLELEQTRLYPWLRGLESGDLEALECPLKALQESSSPVLPVLR